MTKNKNAQHKEMLMFTNKKRVMGCDMDTRTCIFITCSFKTVDSLSLLHFLLQSYKPTRAFWGPLRLSVASPKSTGPFIGDLELFHGSKNPVTKPNLLHFLQSLSLFGNSTRSAFLCFSSFCTI